jgi:hypothetical protein
LGFAFSAGFGGGGVLAVEDEAALAGFADPVFLPVGCPAAFATGCPAALLTGCVASFAAGFGGAPTASPKVTSPSSCSAAFGTASVAAQDKDKPPTRKQCSSLRMDFLIASFLDVSVLIITLPQQAANPPAGARGNPPRTRPVRELPARSVAGAF